MSGSWDARWYGGETGAQAVLRAPLTLLSYAYGAAVRVRNGLYDRGVLPEVRVPGVRVVSVGNVNVGGAGKTPAVIYLANRLMGMGRRVGVLSRGYGRTARGPLHLAPGEPRPAAEVAGDEPLLIAARCPGVHVLVGADRVALARRAALSLGLDTLILDDGFQHRRLARSLDVVVVDEASGFGNGRLLPRGPLREPIGALGRAGLIWVRGSGTPRELGLPSAQVRVRYVPGRWLEPGGGERPPMALSGQAVVALSGIARPEAFERTLKAVGLSVQRHFTVADHAPFPRGMLDEARALAAGRAWPCVTTEKDAVRLPAGFPAWRLRMEVEVLDGGPALEAALEAL